MMFKNSLVLKKVVAVADAPTFAGTLVPTSPGTLVPTSPGTIVATPVPISTPSAPKSNEISERGNVRNVEDKAVSREHSNARGYQCLSICDSSTFCCVKNNRTGASTVVGDVASNDSQVVGESISNTPYCCSIDFQSFSSVRCLPSCNNESSTFNDCDCSIIPSCPKDLPKLSETCYPLIACCETMIQFLCCIIQCLLGGGGPR